MSKDKCFYCNDTGFIHTEDDIPDQMCPNCEIGQAVIKGYNIARDFGIQACDTLRGAKDEQIEQLEAENAKLKKTLKTEKLLTDSTTKAVAKLKADNQNCRFHIERMAEDHKGLKELEAEIEKHRWIPVNEKMPKSPTQYLCCYFPYGGQLPQMYFATTWSKAKGFFLEDGTRVFPTHWKPIILPEQALMGGQEQ